MGSATTSKEGLLSGMDGLLESNSPHLTSQRHIQGTAPRNEYTRKIEQAWDAAVGAPMHTAGRRTPNVKLLFIGGLVAASAVFGSLVLRMRSLAIVVGDTSVIQHQVYTASSEDDFFANS